MLGFLGSIISGAKGTSHFKYQEAFPPNHLHAEIRLRYTMQVKVKQSLYFCYQPFGLFPKPI